VREQRQCFQYERELLHRRHMRLAGPVGVADGDVVGDQAWPGHGCTPAGFAFGFLPREHQVAVDGEGAADGLRDVVVQGWLGAVPVERQHEDDRRCDGDDRGDDQPEGEFAACTHALFVRKTRKSDSPHCYIVRRSSDSIVS